jgi:transcriptional regulator with XRE-family HTH domain
MEPKGSFGPRLRQERERRQISLKSIAANTKISQSLLEALERDDVSRWPSGIFRRAFLRSYATAIGVDADATWKEFAERFPEETGGEPGTPAQPPAPAQRVSVGSAPGPDRHGADYVELVFRVSVPRSWVTWARWLTSRVPAIPRRQSM